MGLLKISQIRFERKNIKKKIFFDIIDDDNDNNLIEINSNNNVGESNKQFQ